MWQRPRDRLRAGIALALSHHSYHLPPPNSFSITSLFVVARTVCTFVGAFYLFLCYTVGLYTESRSAPAFAVGHIRVTSVFFFLSLSLYLFLRLSLRLVIASSNLRRRVERRIEEKAGVSLCLLLFFIFALILPAISREEKGAALSGASEFVEGQSFTTQTLWRRPPAIVQLQF